MSIFKSLLKGAARLEERVDTTLSGGGYKDVIIIPYMGFGTRQMLRLRGRVLSNHKVREGQHTDGKIKNLRNFLRRLRTNEVAYANITATFGDQTRKVTANEEGFFIVQFDLETSLPEKTQWFDIDLHYDDGQQQAHTVGRVIVPAKSQYAVISDMDDTVLKSDVTNLLKLLSNTFFQNEYTRTSFKGVAKFYQALQEGINPDTYNPIFYVSNSPYNLYDLIKRFLELNEIPLGPIFLRDFGLTQKYLLASKQHKFETIDRLMTTYPDLEFILIGDSGEHDPDIYLQVVETYPNRVKAIYIRDVHPHRMGTKQDKHVKDVATKLQEYGVDMLLIPNTATAARHAANNGYILPEAVPGIVNVKSSDEKPIKPEEVIDTIAP